MSWDELFDRAAAYEVTVDDVRATLQAHRAKRRDGGGEEPADDGGDDER